MAELAAAMVVSFGVVFVAELGDKTQLLALGFGAQHSLRTVAIGLTLGYGAANLVAAVIGGILGASLPARPMQIIGGLVFFAFALLAVRRAASNASTDDGAESDRAATSGGAVGATLSIAAAIALAEMGDKTQIATATLASQSPPVAVWLGATLGAAASGMVGAVAGSVVGDRIAVRTLHLASAALFVAFGVAMLAGWF